MTHADVNNCLTQKFLKRNISTPFLHFYGPRNVAQPCLRKIQI